jgi:MFS family permease
LGLDETGFGVLMTSFAIGSLIGTAIAARAEARLGPSNVLFLTVVVSAIMTAIPAFTSSAWVVGASFAVTGATIIMWNVVTVSLRQRIVPDELLGRVNAGYRLLAWGTQPIGALAGGLLAQLFGVGSVFLVGAVLIAALLAARVVVTDDEIVRADLDRPPVMPSL